MYRGEFSSDRAIYPYTQHNHLSYLFQNADGNYDPESTLLVKIGKPKRTLLSPLEEAKLAAREIAEKFPGPLWIPLSGGVDSEAVALSFRQAQVPFQVVICKFNENLNSHDIRYAIEFCEQQGLPYLLMPFDIVKFYESGLHFSLARPHRCRSPQFTVMFEMVRRLQSGTVIFPWQPPNVFFHDDGRAYLGFPEDHFLTYLRFLDNEQRPGVPFFFLYTPELIFSFLQQPTLKKILAGEKLNQSEYAIKCQTYREGGFDINSRPKKFTGFELVKKYLQQKYKATNYIYDQLYREPLQKEFPLPKRTLYFLP